MKDIRKLELNAQKEVLKKASSDIVEYINEAVYNSIDDKTAGNNNLFECWKNDTYDLMNELGSIIDEIDRPGTKIDEDFYKAIRGKYEETYERLDQVDDAIYEYEDDFITASKKPLCEDDIIDFIDDNDLEDLKEKLITIYNAAKEIERLKYFIKYCK